MAYGDFKNLKTKTFSYKVFRDKAFNIVKNLKYEVYQRGLAFRFYKFFDKMSTGRDVVNNNIKQNIQLVKELHKRIMRNFKKRTDHL